MKRNIRGCNKLRRGVSLLLMVSLLITLLPTVSLASTSTVGAYGTVTVTTKNVVIRTSPAGSRTGYFAQKGNYPMIGPVATIDGVEWYNIQTKSTAGYVSGNYATANYGSAGMPGTDKKYVDILYDTVTLIKGNDPAHPVLDGANNPIKVTGLKGQVLQMVNGNSYTATAYATTTAATYINVYYYNGTSYDEYHTLYSNDFVNGIMTTDNLNSYISGVTWKAPTTGLLRSPGAKGDYLTHALQAALNVLDYYSDSVDGSYGDHTSNAVEKFRGDNGMDDNNPNATEEVFTKVFDQATARLEYIRSTNGLGGSGTTPGTVTSYLIKTTVKNLRIRKSYTTSSAYIGMVATAGTILSYTRTYLSGSVTWYYVQYNGTYGWVMGTYVEQYTAPSSGSSTTPPPITNYGTVTITKNLVAIRTAANGSRSGYHVNKGDVCTMIGPAVKAGKYTWYHIRTENGREGYVRGDCAKATFGSAGMPKTNKEYVQFLYPNMQIRKGSDPATATAAWITVPQETVLQLVTGTSYTTNSVAYINVYYKNEVYHAKYTNALTDGMMTEDNTNNYISTVIWAQAFSSTMVAGKEGTTGVTNFKGDIYVHAVQAALYELNYMDDKDDMDGSFGTDTSAAAKDFKADYHVGTATSEIVDDTVSAALFPAAYAALQARLSSSPGGSSDGDVLNAGDFGTVNSVKKGSWSEIDGGSSSLFPKGSVAYVMSVDTKQVFRIYRWSGANHADCVPYDASDTATLSSIVGFTYNSNHPSTAQLTTIKSYGNDDYPRYTWPDFRGGFFGSAISGSKEKIPVWVNLNGTVYCASIYVIPHGFTGTSSFSLSKLNGQYFYERNNFYGMMCVHFYGSTTHSTGTVNATHMSNINYAFNKAASYFGSGKVH